jgi:hypothetical protein
VGARKIALKKANPNRHEALMRIRAEASHDVFIDRHHNEVIINPMKRFLLQKEYKNPELKREVLRRIAKYSVGAKKYEEINKKGEN